MKFALHFEFTNCKSNACVSFLDFDIVEVRPENGDFQIKLNDIGCSEKEIILNKTKLNTGKCLLDLLSEPKKSMLNQNSWNMYDSL